MNHRGEYPNTMAERCGYTDLRQFMDAFVVRFVFLIHGGSGPKVGCGCGPVGGGFQRPDHGHRTHRTLRENSEQFRYAHSFRVSEFSEKGNLTFLVVVSRDENVSEPLLSANT